MVMMFRFHLVVLFIFSIMVQNCWARQPSLFTFHPGAGIEPRPVIRTDLLLARDFGIENLDSTGLWPYAALADVFCGPDPQLRESFQKAFFAKYSTAKNAFATHPGAPLVNNPNLELYTYRKPYEVHQEEFLAWLEKNTKRRDFLSPQSRKWNNFRGDLANPLVRPDQLRDANTLKQTFGQVATLTSDTIEMVVDNKFNPLRWIAPINEVHHHEQASWAMLLRTTSETLRQSEEIIASFWRGDRSQRLMLEYDIELTVEDERAEVGEYSIHDMFGGHDPTRSGTLVERSYDNTKCYADRTVHIEKGSARSALSRESVRKWLETRFIPINIQTSLMINWCENGRVYRLSELMLASKNQQPVFYNPPKKDAPGFFPTANEAVNPFIVDGGTAGNVGWTRMPINVMNKDFFKGEEKKFPVIKSGGEYFKIPDGKSSRRLKGELDLTNFYTLARRQKILAGQRGLWGNKWVGFEGDDSKFADLDEKHGIYWIGLIFEVHGPFRVTVKVHKLDAYVAKD